MTFSYNTQSLSQLKASLKKRNEIFVVDKVENYTINPGSNGGTDVVYFNGAGSFNFEKFTYGQDGKDLIINTGNVTSEENAEETEYQLIRIKNYFTNTSGLATKSSIKILRLDTEEGVVNHNIIAEGIIEREIVLNPTKKNKGAVSGTVFSDTITTNLTAALNSKGKGATINAGSGNDNISATPFNDTITGGAGENTINLDFSDGFGKDVVNLTKGEKLFLNLTKDSVNEDEKVAVGLDELTYTKSGNNLIITKEGDVDNQLTLKNYFKNLATVYLEDVTKEIKSYLTSGTAVLNISGKKKFSGTSYGDNITGSKYADTISAGAGNDTIDAKTNNDTIKLGAGNKTVKISLADGNDTITLSNTTSLNIEYDNTTVDVGSLVYAKGVNGKDLYIYRENNQYTLVKNYFTAAGNATKLKINGVEKDLSSGTATVYNLSKNNTISNVKDGDVVIGGNKTDKVTVTEGNNAINLLKGNDTVNFAAGYAGETILKTSGGTDNILFKGAENLSATRDEDGNIVIENEVGTVEVTVDSYQDKTGTLTIKDKNKAVVSVVKSGSGKLKGTNYDDIIVGSSKNDTITGTKGNDSIYTRGGNDTIVLSNKKSENTVDFIDSTSNTENSKVTLKMDIYDTDGVKEDFTNDLEYSDRLNHFVYKDFFKANTTAAALDIKLGRNVFHTVNINDGHVDYSERKDNNIVFLTDDDNKQDYTGADINGGLNVVYSSNATTFNNKGCSEIYNAIGENNNKYKAKLEKTTQVEISDKGGNDSIELDNEVSGVTLFFNVNKDSSVDMSQEDLALFDTSSFNYNTMLATTYGTVMGSVSVQNYFSDGGKIENLSTTDYQVNLNGWVNFVSDKVREWLEANNKVSVEQVLGLKQIKANKALVKSLLKVYQDATYDEYMNSVTDETLQKELAGKNPADLVFVKNDTTLDVYEKNGSEQYEKIYSYESYFGDDSTAKAVFYAKDSDGKLVEYSVGSGETPLHINSKETVALNSTLNKLSFDDTDSEGVDYAQTHLTVTDGEDATLIFTDREYKDFYTQVIEGKPYNEGDPLIYKGSVAVGNENPAEQWKKGGDNLTIGDVQVDNVDGNKSSILIVDNIGQTKTIIIGSGKTDAETGEGGVNGTFESEIIVASNNDDTINAMGGDDLVYSGDGDDVMNFIPADKTQTPTGNNTAPMVVIGGSGYMPAHTVDSISVYDTSGSDTYNTSFDVGLYVEDLNDTQDSSQANDKDIINITDSATNLCYMMDVINPNYKNNHSTFYTDLFIFDKADKNKFLMAVATAGGLEGLQGKLGYVWIDDQYGETGTIDQKIEQVNLINPETQEVKELNLDYTDESSDLYAIYNSIATWLQGTAESKHYTTAWDVVRGNSYMDKLTLLNLYMGS